MRESKSRALPTWRHPSIDRATTENNTSAPQQPNPSILKSARRRLSAAGAAMGWVIGLEPTTPRATTWYSNQLSYTHRIEILKMARLKGLEPLTHCLEGSCSIHLSYRRIYRAENLQTGSQPSVPYGAGDGNRTHVTSLEGWSSTIEPRPQNS